MFFHFFCFLGTLDSSSLSSTTILGELNSKLMLGSITFLNFKINFLACTLLKILSHEICFSPWGFFLYINSANSLSVLRTLLEAADRLREIIDWCLRCPIFSLRSCSVRFGDEPNLEADDSWCSLLNHFLDFSIPLDWSCRLCRISSSSSSSSTISSSSFTKPLLPSP